MLLAKDGKTILDNPWRSFHVRMEMGERVQAALMTDADWHECVERVLDGMLGE